MPYVRTVKTTSGATAVQIVWSSRRGSREIEHIGSAHDEAEAGAAEGCRAAAARGRAAGAGPGPGSGCGPARAAADHLLADGAPVDALERGYQVLGFGRAAGGDEVFRQLVLARIIEPVSKLDSLRVLEEAGVAPASYATLKRRLPAYAKEAWRQGLSAACAAHAGLGPASLVLYDVSTLVLRDRSGRRVPRERVLQGAAAGAADHHRAARPTRPGSR